MTLPARSCVALAATLGGTSLLRLAAGVVILAAAVLPMTSWKAIGMFMIRAYKYNNALAALNAVLVVARKLAYDRRPHQQLTDVLDAAEYLPRLLAGAGDETDAFREALIGLTSIDPGFGFAVERFDRDDLGQW